MSDDIHVWHGHSHGMRMSSAVPIHPPTDAWREMASVPGEVRVGLYNICKSFSGVQVLNDVTLEMRSGEVLALVGENGAGKSTLMKVLMGVISKDNGVVKINGSVQDKYDTKAARQCGVTMIPQELALIPALSVAENIFLGQLPRRRNTFVDWSRVYLDAGALISELGFDLDPYDRVDRLPIAYRQMASILKAVADGAEVIIMDEPSSSLGKDEVNRLMGIISKLRSRGTTIIYISHLIDEVFRISDRIAVLRDGRLVDVKETVQTTPREIVSLMVGESLLRTQEHIADKKHGQHANGDNQIAQNKRPVLEVTKLRQKASGPGVSFALHEGEVLGIVGLVGSGKTELARCLVGLDKVHSGEIKVNGQLTEIRNPRDAMINGIVMVPEDRKLQGLVLPMSVRENISLAMNYRKRISQVGFIDRQREYKDCQTYIDRLSIKVSSMEQPVIRLSGGNQQKVVLSKALLGNPTILILDEPTRGIDVGAKASIYSLVRSLREKGFSVLLLSSEIPEVLLMSDRILVMRAGDIVAEIPGNQATQDMILEHAAGGNQYV